MLIASAAFAACHSKWLFTLVEPTSLTNHNNPDPVFIKLPTYLFKSRLVFILINYAFLSSLLTRTRKHFTFSNMKDFIVAYEHICETQKLRQPIKLASTVNLE